MQNLHGHCKRKMCKSCTSLFLRVHFLLGGSLFHVWLTLFGWVQRRDDSQDFRPALWGQPLPGPHELSEVIPARRGGVHLDKGARGTLNAAASRTRKSCVKAVSPLSTRLIVDRSTFTICASLSWLQPCALRHSATKCGGRGGRLGGFAGDMV